MVSAAVFGTLYSVDPGTGDLRTQDAGTQGPRTRGPRDPNWHALCMYVQ